ncbi:MAG TPA: WD40 repeat domain-containing protein [Pyrinomonadaceae bacterium]|jgi:WD40 repeat protein
MKATSRKLSRRLALALCAAAALWAAAAPCALARQDAPPEAREPRPAAQAPPPAQPAQAPQAAQASQAAQTPQAADAPRLVAALEGYEGPSLMSGRRVLAVFSPDGRTLALSGPKRAVGLYDAATGRLLHTLSAERDADGFNGFSFSPDSRVAATRNVPDRSVSLWDVATGRLLLKLPGRDRDIETKFKAANTPAEEFVAVPFSPDGRVVLTEREDDVVVGWEVATGRELFRLEHKTETNAAGDVLGALFFSGALHPLMMSAAYSPDGARLVTANGDKNPKLWDAATGRLVATLASPGDYVYAAAFLPAAGGLVTVSFKGEANLWDASTGAHRQKLARDAGDKFVFEIGHDGGRLALSPDGRLVAARVEDGKTDEVKIWDAADGRTLATLGKDESDLLAFSPDGRTLAAAGGDKRATAQLLDAATGRPRLALARTDGGARALAFSPDGRLVVTTGGRGVRLWDAETGAPVATLDRARFPAHFSPDGRRLVTGGTDKTAYLYEIPGR